MKIERLLTPFNASSRGGAKIKYLVIHDVGVRGQTARDNAKYFSSGYVGASAHYFVDRTSIWQVVLDDRASWHCGDGAGKYGITNENSLGIEMIVEQNGTIHPETQNRTRWLIQTLLAKHQLSAAQVKRHFDASRKNCPQHMNANGNWAEWQAFLKTLSLSAAGWVLESGTWVYYLDGQKQRGWLLDPKNQGWFYLDQAGAMQVGWQKIKEHWYYLDANGRMRTGWLLSGGKWYYLATPSGEMVTGTQQIEGRLYLFDTSGAWTDK